MDRYIRAVAICNSLALLASQGTMVQFIQRIAILTRLQKYWKKGYDTVTLSCADYDDGQDNDDDNGFEENVDDASIALQAAAALASVEHPDNWETHSNSTVDLKPDIHAVASEPELSEPDEKPERKSRKKPEAGKNISSSVLACLYCWLFVKGFWLSCYTIILTCVVERQCVILICNPMLLSIIYEGFLILY